MCWQALYRGRLARKERDKRRRRRDRRGETEEGAAIMIQAVVRGRRGRRLAVRRAMETQLREQAALFIQTRWRARQGCVVAASLAPAHVAAG